MSDRPWTRRQALAAGGTISSAVVAGCIRAPSGRPPAGGNRVVLVDTDSIPLISAQPSVEVSSPQITESSPGIVTATVTNMSDDTILVGEERAIVFAYVQSEQTPGLQLLPEPASQYPASHPGCWRLSSGIAIAEYYGTVELSQGESVNANLGVWALPEVRDACVPVGEYRFQTQFTVWEGRELNDAEETATWGFTLAVRE